MSNREIDIDKIIQRIESIRQHIEIEKGPSIPDGIDENSLRDLCKELLNAASFKTLKLVGTLLLNADPKADRTKIETTFIHTSGATNSIAFFPEGDTNTVAGLAEWLWMYLINNAERTIRENLVEARRHPTYRNSKVWDQIQVLCIAGCGNTKGGTGEYCGDNCRKALSGWINRQATSSENKRTKNVRQRAQRLAGKLSQLKREIPSKYSSQI